MTITRELSDAATVQQRDQPWINRQSTIPEYRFAGFWQRFLAAAIDECILAVSSGTAAAAIGIVLAANGSSMELVQLVLVVLLVSCSWLYFALFESSALQATPGKRACGLLVTDRDGGRIAFWPATGRYFAKTLSGLIFGIGFFMAGWTKRRQALHDLLCSTLVLEKLNQGGRITLPE